MRFREGGSSGGGLCSVGPEGPPEDVPTPPEEPPSRKRTRTKTRSSYTYPYQGRPMAARAGRNSVSYPESSTGANVHFKMGNRIGTHSRTTPAAIGRRHPNQSSRPYPGRGLLSGCWNVFRWPLRANETETIRRGGPDPDNRVTAQQPGATSHAGQSKRR